MDALLERVSSLAGNEDSGEEIEPRAESSPFLDDES